jgi:hypothetical protein
MTISQSTPAGVSIIYWEPKSLSAQAHIDKADKMSVVPYRGKAATKSLSPWERVAAKPPGEGLNSPQLARFLSNK